MKTNYNKQITHLETQLTVAITKDNEGFFIGQIIEYPSVISEGESEKELIENIKDVFKMALEYDN